jgi:hypothetical protein
MRWHFIPLAEWSLSKKLYILVHDLIEEKLDFIINYAIKYRKGKCSMHIQKVYLKTTMFNYFVEKTKEDSPVTVAFFEAIMSGKYDGYTSTYAIEEMESATEPKRSEMLALIDKYQITVLDATEEADRLASVYIQNGIIPEKKNLDAQHIAIATIT